MRSNPALNLAPFGRWTLRDEAAQRRLALLQGLPHKEQVPRWFSGSSFFPDPISLLLPSSCEKVKDCGTTTGHIEHHRARALMKDARRDLNR